MNRIIFDVGTKRRKDENGFLHVESCHISKQAVNPYYGHEVPNWQNSGLTANRIYWGYRCGKELARGASSFNGLPLLYGHQQESADRPCKDKRVGSLGSNAVFIEPYLDNSLTVTDAKAISAIESGHCRQLSAAYMFDPIFTKGVYKGQAYDFIMTNIRGNHVALVEEGRAGPEVAVADGQLSERKKKMGIINKIKELIASSENSGADDDGINNTRLEPDFSLRENQQQLYDDFEQIVIDIEDSFLRERLQDILMRLAFLIGIANEDLDSESLSSFDEGQTADSSLKFHLLKNNASALNKAHRHFKNLYEAARQVRPLVGEINHMSFDSAGDIYSYALRSHGFQPKTKQSLALREMVDLMKRESTSAYVSTQVKQPFEGHFSHLSRIKL